MSNYNYYKERLKELEFPYVVLDTNLFNKNIQVNLERAGNKKIRLASKSLRCEHAMKMILDYNDQFQGIMTYSAKETLYLAEKGFNDLLIGYPVVSYSLIKALGEAIKNGKQICLMVDALAHLKMINTVGKALNVKMPICIDLDLSSDLPGLRFGVWRSSVMTIKDLEIILKALKKMDYLTLEGLMGYEAQIAGVGDHVKGDFLKNKVIRKLKKQSIKRVVKKRQLAAELVSSEGHTLRFFNGGGTGSLESTIREDAITEVTVGSGFFNAHLFDNYLNYKLNPALFYAIQVVRKPKETIYTCHGGGYIASGAIEKIKAPIVHLPKSGVLDKLEGAGEVQTPIRFKITPSDLEIGDPIFMRHAKSGELCERFNKIYFLSDSELIEANTYRGENKNFG